MNAAVIEDTTLSCMARFIMLWILRSPSEAINPDAIAQDNHIPLKTVKALLSELVEHNYLVKPERVNNPAKAGQFTWTPYTLNPYYGEPSHGETVDGQQADGRAEQPSDQKPSMAIAGNGKSSGFEYVRAAGESALSKNSPVLSEKQKTGQGLVADSVQGMGEWYPPGQVAPPMISITANVQPINPAQNLPAMSEAEFETALTQASPAAQSAFPALLEKAQPPVPEQQSAPPPIASAPSPDEFAAEIYWHEQLPKHFLSKPYKKRLKAVVGKYGLPAVKEIIDQAKEREAYAPMKYIEVALEGQESEGKLPGQSPPATHSQATAQSSPHQDYERNFRQGFKGFDPVPTGGK